MNYLKIYRKDAKGREPVHKKQVLTFLKISDLKSGWLVNFNEAAIKEGITKAVNNL